MYPQVIERYFQPVTPSEVVRLLGEHGTAASLIAGGQSLVPQLKARTRTTQALIDINRVHELDVVAVTSDGLHCGALVRFTHAAQHGAILARWTALAEAAAAIGDRQVRNRGTLLGSLVFAAHWGDIAPAAAALNARVELLGPDGQRSLALDAFVLAPGRTALGHDEFATGIALPHTPAGSAYLKHGRAAQDRATLGIAVAVHCDERGRCSAVRIAIGGLASHPAQRASAVEQLLDGETLGPALLHEAGTLAAAGLVTQNDELASADYRAQLLRVYLPRALELAAVRSAEYRP